MKIEIVYPFLDLRRLSSVKCNLLAKRPQWPSNKRQHATYYRCMGQVFPFQCYTQDSRNKYLTPSCIANGIVFKDLSFPGLVGINRVIDFMYDNDLFGVYSFTFFTKTGTFRNSSIYSITDLFAEVKAEVKDLIDKYTNLRLDSLNGALCRQYYWATRLLTDSNDKTIKYYQRDPNIKVGDVNKIVIPTQQMEMKDIRFLKPYIIVEFTEEESIIDGMQGVNFLRRRTALVKDIGKVNLIAIKKIMKSEDLTSQRDLSNYRNSLRYVFLLLDLIDALSLYKATPNDDLSSKYLDQLAATYELLSKRKYFNEAKELYAKLYPNIDAITEIEKQLNANYGCNNLSAILNNLHQPLIPA